MRDMTDGDILAAFTCHLAPRRLDVLCQVGAAPVPHFFDDPLTLNLSIVALAPPSRKSLLSDSFFYSHGLTLGGITLDSNVFGPLIIS